MKDEASDALFDTSEPAMSERVLRFRRRVQESPIDRALQSMALAIEDLDGAMLLAKTPEELASISSAIDGFITRLAISASVAATLESMKEWL